MRRPLIFMAAVAVVAGLVPVFALIIGDASQGGAHGGSDVAFFGGAIALSAWLGGAVWLSISVFRRVTTSAIAAFGASAGILIGAMVIGAAYGMFVVFGLALILSEGCCA